MKTYLSLLLVLLATVAQAQDKTSYPGLFSAPVIQSITGNLNRIVLTNAMGSNEVRLGVAQLTNVSFVLLSDGHSLFWNSTMEKFTNSPGGSGSGSSNMLTAEIGTLNSTNAIQFQLSNTVNVGSFLHPAKTNYANAFVAMSGGGTNHFGKTMFDDYVFIRPATNNGQNYLRIDDTNGTARLQFGVYQGFTEFGGVWLGDVIPATTNYTLTSDGTTTSINGFGTVALSTGTGGSKWIVTSAGHFLAATDNFYDIGAASDTRPRNIYVASTNVAGTMFITGTTNQVFFGGTNPPPVSTAAPTKWISVKIVGDAANYRLPLYQ